MSSSGDEVVLRVRGKEIPYPLEKLSEADREWVAEQVAGDDRADADRVAAPTGKRTDLPITERLFADLGGYRKDRTRRDVFDAFEAGAYSNARLPQDQPEEWMERDPGKDRYHLYVPESYDGSEAYGLYLHIAPSADGGFPGSWHPLFDERKLIAVAAKEVGNNQPMMRRVTLSVDAMQTVEKDYEIDPDRRIVGGYSGGGHMAMLTAAMFPERFIGAVSHAAQSLLPSDPKYNSHFPGMDMRDFKRAPRDEIKWSVISGEKDQNYKEIRRTSEVWADERLNYRFIDVPGMGHSNAPPESFAEALDWILN